MASTFRVLVACAACKLQYDATGHPVGSRFRCSCGELVTVPEERPHDSVVVRCSACGGPRRGDEPACGFCDSDFTLHERDLLTVCPACATRISSRARFCHSCAQPIVAQATAGESTTYTCPACGEGRQLYSRRLGTEERVAVLECGSCAGLWLGNEVFRLLESRALETESTFQMPQGRGTEVPAARAGDGSPRGELPASLYRPCVRCGKLMHRRNYGRKSGVIVDTCAAHGLWFDLGELDRVLGWVRGGGRRRSDEAAEHERRHRQRMKRIQAPELPEEPPAAHGAVTLIDLIGKIISFL